ncbi:MAG: glycosyltransferase [Cyanobacteria bacterium J06648_1]
MNVDSADVSINTFHQPSSKLRILFVSHAYVTGVNQSKLAAIAATEEATVGLVVPKTWKAKGWQKFLRLETPYPQLKVYPSQTCFAGRVGAFVYAPWTIWQALQEFQPDIVHVEQEVFSLAALELALLTKILNIPVAYFGWENMDRSLSPLRRWLRYFVLDYAQLVIAGNREGEALVKQWGYQKTTAVMPQLGVDAALFAPRERNPSKEFKIGYLGRMLYQKGIDTLFTTAKYLAQENCSFKIIICGSGLEHDLLKDEAQQQNLSSVIEWRDGVPHAQVPEVMSEFDVLVLPSRTGNTWKEQFGHVLIEAMCMKIPVIGSTCGEIPHVIARNDLVFPEGDGLALAKIIQRMISEPDWYETVKNYGYKRVKEEFTHERIAQKLIGLWRKVLAQ